MLPTRQQFKIMEAIGSRSITLSSLAKDIGCSLPKLSYHIKAMVAEGQIKMVKKGKSRFVSLLSREIQNGKINIVIL